MSRALVVGYGNTLRQDDGVGCAVAERFRGRPGVDAHVCHQLTPELAETISRYEVVVFVDARVGGGGVEVAPVGPAGGGGAFGHSFPPEAVLALCGALHERAPRAWVVTIPAVELGFGEGLSAAGAAGAEEAVAWIAYLLTNL